MGIDIVYGNRYDKLLKYGKEVAKALLFIGAGVQILFGACWLAFNLTSVQEFGDRYGGILYPILVWLAKGIGKLVPVPFYTVLYLLQLLAAFYCAKRLIKAFCGEDGLGRRELWHTYGGAYLVTVPISIQCHMAVMPHSLTSSLLILQMAVLLEIMRKRSGGRNLAGMAALWIICALLMPEYLYLAGLPVLMGIWIYLVGRKGLKKTAFAAIAGIIFVVMAVNAVFRSQYLADRDKVGNSLRAAVVGRLVWPYFVSHYDAWPEEIRTVMDSRVAWDISQNTEQVSSLFIPMIEEALGEGRARTLYWQMILTTLDYRTKDIASAITLDALSYAAPLLAIPGQLDGEERWLAYGGNFTGRNYEIMRGASPALTKYYMSYGCRWFLLGIITALFLELTGEGRAVIKNRPVGGIRTQGENCLAGGTRTQGENCLAGGTRTQGENRPAGGTRTQGENRPVGGIRTQGENCLAGGTRTGGKLSGVGVTAGMACAIILYYTMRGAGMMDYKNGVYVTGLWCVWMFRKMR